MNIISRNAITAFTDKHQQSKSSFDTWYNLVKKSKFKNFNEVKALFRSADYFKGKVIFNIGGNNHRLIAKIRYQTGVLYIRHILTHAEYSKNKWKKDDP